MTAPIHQYRYYSPENASGEAGIRLSQRLVSILVEELPGSSVCELGCGNGFLADLLQAAGHEVVGVDVSESGIEIARRKLGERAELLCSPIDRRLVSRLGEARFAAVVSSEVIEHLYRPAELLETAYGLLKPGGLLVLTTPYHGYWKNLAIVALGKFDSHFTPLWDGGHIKFFNVRSLRTLVEQCGFIDVRFGYFGRVPGFWKSMVCITRKPGLRTPLE